MYIRKVFFLLFEQVRSDKLKKTDPTFVQRNAAFLLDTLLSLVRKVEASLKAWLIRQNQPDKSSDSRFVLVETIAGLVEKKNASVGEFTMLNDRSTPVLL